jgi:hypothetical protein
LSTNLEEHYDHLDPEEAFQKKLDTFVSQRRWKAIEILFRQYGTLLELKEPLPEPVTPALDLLQQEVEVRELIPHESTPLAEQAVKSVLPDVIDQDAQDVTQTQTVPLLPAVKKAEVIPGVIAKQ